MGCKGSKASAPQCATTPGKATLLDAPSEKNVVEGTETSAFPIFMDMKKGISSGCLAINQDEAALEVCDVTGGPIGLWNNRARTVKVRTGDCVVRVRKVGWSDTQWIANDAKEMMNTLAADGTFEVEIRRGTGAPKASQESVQDRAPQEKKEQVVPAQPNLETKVEEAGKAAEVPDNVVAVAPVDSQAEAVPEAAEEAPPFEGSQVQPIETKVELIEAKVEGEAEVKKAGCGFCAN